MSFFIPTDKWLRIQPRAPRLWNPFEKGAVETLLYKDISVAPMGTWDVSVHKGKRCAQWEQGYIYDLLSARH